MSSSKKTLMGTLAWGKNTKGKLNENEKIALARNVALLQSEIVFDEFRTNLGLLNPIAIDINTLTPPDTKLVRDSDTLARENYDETLWNHCMRTYYFGALVAAFDGIKFDRELFYAAAICHDLGVNQDKSGSISCNCFAHSGGVLTHNHLIELGHSPDKAIKVGDAISTHMNLYVPLNDYPAESSLTAIGATCDIIGAYVRRIEINTLNQVVKQWPRTGVMEAFGEFLKSNHMGDCRTSLLGEMGAFSNDGDHPIDKILDKI